ncbi:unnamed protein product [Dicrocoelium dendriticum]|nr:unnamed protein product [Dicrocoelium dendriticum]
MIEIPAVVRTGLLGKFFPFGFCYEFKHLIRLAIPIALTTLVAFLSGPISVISCGLLGKHTLATVGLATSMFNVTGLAVITGLLTAADTLFSQTYGSNRTHMMGIQLQRAIVIITFCCIPCVALHLLAEPVLLLMQQNPQIAKEAADYLLCATPGLWFAAIGQCLTKYLQAQNTVYPPLWIGIIGNCLNALLHYLLLYVINVGVRGSAFSQVIAYAFQCACLVAYIMFKERNSSIWTGVSSKLWLDWGTWLKLALSGLIMVALEWTIFELGTVIAGTLSQKQLSAQTILFNTETMLYILVPLGFGMATNVRVGQFLGAGSAVGPKSVLSVALVTVLLLTSTFATGVFLLRWQIPKAFTSDSDVIELTAHLLPIIAAFQLFDGTSGVCQGAIRGAGLQFIGAITCFCSQYLFGASIALLLVFLAGYGLHGLWIGFTVGTVSQALVYCGVCKCIDWKKQVEMARERTSDVRIVVPDENTLDVCSSANSLMGRYNEDLDSTTTLSSQQTEKEALSKITKKSPIPFRILFGFILIVLLVTSACLRQYLPWSDYFGFYCVFPNDTFIRVSSRIPVPTNCSLVVPGTPP